MNTMRRNRTVWKRIIPASILLICVIAGFAAYINANRRMTVDRNARYVEDAATQTANRIEDLLIGAENSISAIARLYGQTMEPGRIDTQTLQKLVDDTPFDYIGIVDADGIYTHLQQQGIIVRNRNKVEKCLGCLRITVGTPEENNAVINGIKSYDIK